MTWPMPNDLRDISDRHDLPAGVDQALNVAARRIEDLRAQLAAAIEERDAMRRSLERSVHLIEHEREVLRAERDAAVAAKDGAYSERDQCVALIARMALSLGYRAGLGHHGDGEWDDDWRNIVFVELPAGQVSWHIHDSELPLFNFLRPYEAPWDGHTTPEKYERCKQPVPNARAERAERLAHRLQHGQTIEGDAFCEYRIRGDALAEAVEAFRDAAKGDDAMLESVAKNAMLTALAAWRGEG